jgi:thioredoxin-like negative regulator of GroEL
MAIKSETDVINAINSILKISPTAFELIFQAIAISLKNKNFSEAKKHIPSIKKTKKGKLVEAVIYSEEGIAHKNIDLLEKAFKIEPGLTENAIHYADYLSKKGEYRNAQKVLLQSFKCTQIYDVYERYINCGENISNSDRFKFAEKIMNEAPDSWIVYFEFAKIALQNGMILMAFQNFFKAYQKEHYDFIVERLVETAKMLDEPKPQSAVDVLSTPLASKHVQFIWKCRHCGNEEKRWIPVCNHCGRIGEYVNEERSIDGENLSIDIL